MAVRPWFAVHPKEVAHSLQGSVRWQRLGPFKFGGGLMYRKVRRHELHKITHPVQPCKPRPLVRQGAGAESVHACMCVECASLKQQLCEVGLRGPLWPCALARACYPPRLASSSSVSHRARGVASSQKLLACVPHVTRALLVQACNVGVGVRRGGLFVCMRVRVCVCVLYVCV